LLVETLQGNLAIVKAASTLSPSAGTDFIEAYKLIKRDLESTTRQ
jgi:hypothetical protein